MIEASGLRRVVACKPVVDDEAEAECSSSRTTSSIGKDSDVSSSSEADSGENEAQSAYNGPLDMMESLEEVLPIRRGISKFYNGKSKSFTTLADASTSPSVKEIAKPENAYSRRRRNLMAFNHVWDKLRSNGGGISKIRTMSSSRSSLALAFAMNYDSCSSCTSEDSISSSNSMSPVPSPSPLPPLHPLNHRVLSAGASPWRSFSVVDLQHCASAATIKIPGSSLGTEAAHPS